MLFESVYSQNRLDLTLGRRGRVDYGGFWPAGYGRMGFSKWEFLKSKLVSLKGLVGDLVVFPFLFNEIFIILLILWVI